MCADLIIHVPQEKWSDDVSFMAASHTAVSQWRTPVVMKVTPHFGPFAGGTVINITGQHLDGDVSCEINGKLCTAVRKVVDSHKTLVALECVTPAFDEPPDAIDAQPRIDIYSLDVVLKRRVQLTAGAQPTFGVEAGYSQAQFTYLRGSCG